MTKLKVGTYRVIDYKGLQIKLQPSGAFAKSYNVWIIYPKNSWYASGYRWLGFGRNYKAALAKGKKAINEWKEPWREIKKLKRERRLK